METEEITLLTIKKAGKRTIIECTPDTNNYEILGIITTYKKKLEEELQNEWSEEE